MSSYGAMSQLASTMPPATTMQNGATANGNGSSLPVTGFATGLLNITASVPISGGTTINFEASVDDTTWVPILGSLVGTTTTGTSTTDAGDWTFAIAGYKSMRARISAYSAGTITVKGYASVLEGGGNGGAGGGSGDVNLNQVAGNSTAVNNGAANNGTQRVVLASDNAGPVAATQSGTWNINNVSGTISLPTGAATSAKQPALGTAGSASSDVMTVQGIASMTALKVDGSAVTQPISAASLPLPTGAATAARQALPGTAGSASSEVLTVQGIASMTALKVDGSAVNQPTNLEKVGGNTVAVGNGTASSGCQRVTIASDNTAFTVNSAQSGTWNINNISGTVSLPTGAATAARQALPGTAGSPTNEVLTVQGRSGMTALDVNVVSGGGGSSNITQWNGNTVATNSGASSAGTLRVVVANDTTVQVVQDVSEKKTYIMSTPAFTPPASTTDMAAIFAKSGYVLKVLKVMFSYDISSGSAENRFFLVKRQSTATNTQGNATAVAPVPLDSNNGSSNAETSLCGYYTSNPALGDTIGTVGQFTVAASGSNIKTHTIFDSKDTGQPIVLRASGSNKDGLVLNNGGVSVPGTGKTLVVTFMWTEETA